MQKEELEIVLVDFLVKKYVERQDKILGALKYLYESYNLSKQQTQEGK